MRRKNTWFSCIYSLNAFIPHNRLTSNHQRGNYICSAQHLLSTCVCHWYWTYSDNPEIHNPVSIYSQCCTLTTSCLKTIPVCHLICFFLFVQLSVSHIYYLMACLHPLTFLFCLSLCQERRCCLWTPQIWMRLGSLVRSLSSIPCRAAHSSDSTLAQVNNGIHIHTCPLTLMLF